MSNSCPTALERRLRAVIEDELRRYPHYVGVVSVSDVATDLIPVLVPVVESFTEAHYDPALEA